MRSAEYVNSRETVQQQVSYAPGEAATRRFITRHTKFQVLRVACSRFQR